jgi:DNA polymerase III subunit gamma/tau
MAYRALYREWRPQSFADMVGQEHVTRTLKNALRTHRFAHAYLFSGPRGTGKTSTAKIMAKAINCEHGPAEEPCNQCAACRGITEGSIMDVVEIDAASNRGVDEIRDLREQVRYAPTEVRFKVYIIDEVHMLTTEAFNALLKTLEEPPAHVMFILATTEPHKLPATILSRCQRFEFRRITGEQIVERLRLIAKEMDVEVEEEALWLLARVAEGGMRDALSIFDQAIAFGGGRVTMEEMTVLLGGVPSEVIGKIAEAIARKDMQEGLRMISQMVDAGKDVTQILHELQLYYRDLLMYKTVPDLQEIKERIHYDKRFPKVAEMYESSVLVDLLEKMTETQNEMKWQPNGRLLLEMLVVRLCKTESVDTETLMKRISELEKKIAEGALRAPAVPSVNPVQVRGNERPVHPGPQAYRRPSGTSEMSRSATGAEEQTPANSPSLVTRGVPPNAADGKPVKISAQQLLQWLKEADEEKLQTVTQQWTQILNQVKKVKITTQAWLSDGEPVAVARDRIIVAFRNQIHRETVMKPVNKQIVDQVFTQVMGSHYQLVAILQSEWNQLQEMRVEGTETANDTPQTQPHGQEDWVEQIVRIFGKDIVEIKD